MENKKKQSAMMCTGLVFGICMGIFLHNIALWLPIGLCLGLCLGAAMEKNDRKNTAGREKEYDGINLVRIEKADRKDLEEILKLQYLAYQSEAALFGNKDIPPLKQTIDEVIEEYEQGLILKMVDDSMIIGSIRAREADGTVYIGKLMVHPDHRRKGYGRRLLEAIEGYYSGKRYELFTSTKSINNIRLYQNSGYKEFNRRIFKDDLIFVYMEKNKESKV